MSHKGHDQFLEYLSDNYDLSLIQAAPDMLCALETILYRINECRIKQKPLGKNWVEYLEFHIAKAKGEK